MERIITEGLDLPTRNIVKDIIKIVRTGEVGSYELPLEINGEDYYKHDMSVYFDWTKEWKENNQKYFVDGNYDDESSTMQVVLFINEDYYPELLYDLIADLNDIVRHEYEHHMQNIGLRPDEEFNELDFEDQPTDYTYYLQPHEIPAVLQGLRRVMKLRKVSLEDALDDWYKRTFDEKTMSKSDYSKLKKELRKEYDKRYGKK
jgi:hypothetical protein